VENIMANTLRLKKANRILTVAEELADGYLARGYDVIDKDGNVTKEATGGKTITVAEHNKLKARLREAEKNQNAGEAQIRIEELEDELKKMTEKAKEFADKGKALKEENDKLKAQVNKK
jgi:flagellar basal body rod protein FlgG